MEQELDIKRIPRHIAIIMDGNGRWAKERGKERSFGHQAGVDTVRRITFGVRATRSKIPNAIHFLHRKLE